MTAEMKPRRIRRLVPCPAYDVEKIESWLQDMSREGWILEKDGDIFGWLAFIQGAPQSVRYRLEPKEPGTGFGDVPDLEIQELCQEYGWEYVDSYGDFFIYRALSSDAREMNTDLSVQAAAIKTGRRSSMATLILDAVLLGNLFSHFFQMPFWSLVHMGLAYHLAHLVALVWVTADSFLHWLHLHRLHTQLKANTPLEHNKPWKQGAAFHLVSKAVYILVIFALFGVIFSSCTRSMDLDYTPTGDYPGDPPFVTASDIRPDGEFTQKSFLQSYNAYTADTTFFAPRIIEWREYGEILTSEGERYQGTLTITYYDLRSPNLAEGLMADLFREAKVKTHFVLLPVPALDVDEAMCYNNIYPTILIRQGNIVVEASVGLESGGAYLLEEWAQQMAEMLVRE